MSPERLSLTGHYVLAYDLNMVVAVRACVLMPEANHVTQLMDHDTKLVAVLPNGNCLWSIATLPNERAASATETNIVVKPPLHTSSLVLHTFGIPLCMQL
jgi:hypothetical protein